MAFAARAPLGLAARDVAALAADFVPDAPARPGADLATADARDDFEAVREARGLDFMAAGM